jgi:hypothetical protein
MAGHSRDNTLSDGTVVDAVVVGRVLGIKLLRVTARITLLPASAQPIVTLDGSAVAPPLDRGNLSDAVSLLAHASRTMRDARRNSL